MRVKLEMYFDEREYKQMYPGLSNEQLVEMFKEDFVDTIQKQYTYNDVFEALEIEEDN